MAKCVQNDQKFCEKEHHILNMQTKKASKRTFCVDIVWTIKSSNNYGCILTIQCE